MGSLANKNIVLGMTGSIAAYKSPDLVRRLREAHATVRVVMSENAKQFITPLTLQAVSGFPVHDQLFDTQAEAAMGHIELARWADLILVAPTTADFMARLINGQANDLLTTICLATRAPIALAPAMNQGMWGHQLTQHNIQKLKQAGIHLLGTNEGSQACGDTGPGRMLEPKQIVDRIQPLLRNGRMQGHKVIITAGPTHEAIDPVRYITNGSSGKMGYELAASAIAAGAEVTLVSGPVSIAPPKGVNLIQVVTAKEMHDAVMRNITDYDIFLAVAAVGDYHPETTAPQKIPKTDAGMTIKLEINPDIVKSVGALSVKPFVVGFAAETEHVKERATLKRKRKNMDMIIANEVGKNKGMGTDENAVIVITKDHAISIPLMSKSKLAYELIMIIADEFNKRDQS